MARAKTGRMLGADELKIFIETARTQNMTRAAERIGLSQPALSHAVRRIEDDMGVILFHRSKKGLKLTKAGEKLLERGDGLLREWEKLHRSIVEDEENIAGQFRFGCHQSVALYALPMFLPDLQRKFPLVDLQIHHGWSRHVAEDVISGRLEIGIVVNPPPHPDLVIKDFVRDEVGLWISSRKKAAEVLIWDAQLMQSQWLVRELERRKVFYPRRIETASLELVRELTVQGCGVGILPGRVASIAPGLVRAHSEVATFKDRVCVIYRMDTEKTAAFKALLSIVQVGSKSS